MQNKLLLTLSSIAISLSLSSAVYAGGGGSDGKWYIGADIGATNNNIDEADFFTGGECANPAINCPFDDTDSAARIVAGYNITPNLALEVGYADLGKTVSLTPSNAAAAAVVQQDTTAFSFAAVGKKKLGKASKLSAVGKLGVSYWDSDISFDRTPDLATFPDQTQSDSGWDPMLGIGLEYAVNNSWNLRAGWDRYFSVGERDQAVDITNANLKTVDTDVDVFYVGASVAF